MPECFSCGGTHYLSTCLYRHQMEKVRMEEERNPTPTTIANTMLVQDSICREIDDLSNNEAIECEKDADDIYNFAFTCVGEEIKTQPITNTQQIVLSQKSHGNKISPKWILLDSHSMINIFNNQKFSKYIRRCEPNESVQCYCNG